MTKITLKDNNFYWKHKKDSYELRKKDDFLKSQEYRLYKNFKYTPYTVVRSTGSGVWLVQRDGISVGQLESVHSPTTAPAEAMYRYLEGVLYV